MLALLLVACSTVPVSSGRAAVVSDIGELGWLAGHWQGEQAEELWMPPRAGSMVGAGRVVQSDKTVFHEYLRIEQRNGTVRYWGAPEGGPATPFDLVEVQQGRAVFENAAHDFPQRIVYEAADDALVVRVSRLDEEGEPLRLVRMP